jgi:hypothetical protein
MSSERPTGTKRIAVLTAAGLVAVGMLTGVQIAARDGGSAAGTRSSAGPCDASSSRKVTQPTPAQLRAAGLGKLTIASSRRRVDLVAPPFSNPTAVTNPPFPIAGCSRRS